MKVAIDRDLEPLIPEYLANRAADIRELRHCQGRGDRRMLVAVAHRLKGVGGSYGFSVLSALAGELEAEGPLATDTRIGALIQAMADYLDSLEIEYR